MNTLTVLGCQVEVPDIATAGQRDAHVRRVADAISVRLQERHADLVVLPELSTISYDRSTFELLEELAEKLDGASVAQFARLARESDTTVVFGMPRRVDGEFRISQVVIGPDGNTIACYDKLHAAQYGLSMEKEFFATGRTLVTFDVQGVRIAPIICYDIRFPELCRTLAVDHGAELILHCSAFGRDESFDSWHSFVTARAMENQLYVLGLSRAGRDWGGSILCGPWVDGRHPAVPFPEHDEAFEYLTIDRAEISRVRRHYTFLADTLADYGALPRSET